MVFLELDKSALNSFQKGSQVEFIDVNFLGAYSSSSSLLCNTRKYHGLFTVPQKGEEFNIVILSNINEKVFSKEGCFELGNFDYKSVVHPKGYQYLNSFKYDRLPTWIYSNNKVKVQKELLLVNNENQLLIKYENKGQESIKMVLEPYLVYREIHKLAKKNELDFDLKELINGIQYNHLNSEYDSLNIQFSKKVKFISNTDWHYAHYYSVEDERGYDCFEDSFRGGGFEFELKKGQEIICSVSLNTTEPRSIKKIWEKEKSLKLKVKNLESCLERSGIQLISKRDEGFQVCAGYHWFGRWGRDTFIALPGLAYVIKDKSIAVDVLKTMAKDLNNGLFTNIGVEGSAKYNSIDAPLLFFWTIQQLLKQKVKFDVWKLFKNSFLGILDNFKNGTVYNIHLDNLGLLYGGEDGVALTWMDAVVNDQPVTQRKGYCIEINALWYNAISFFIELAEKNNELDLANKWLEVKNRIEQNFSKFWNEGKGCFYDYLDEKYNPNLDLRPNQLFALSLPNSLVNSEQRKSVLNLIKEELLTPVGLRTLNSSNENYIGVYKGSQATRDQSYHQGTVWPWLLGVFCEGWLREYKTDGLVFVKEIYGNFAARLREYGLGNIAEIYDGDAPHNPKGTINQAWSVSELIRIAQMIKEVELKGTIL